MQKRAQKLIISFKKYLLSKRWLQGFRSKYNSGGTFLKSNNGQVVIEYFVLFAIIAAITIIGMSKLFPRLQSSFVDMQHGAMERVIKADGNN